MNKAHLYRYFYYSVILLGIGCKGNPSCPEPSDSYRYMSEKNKSAFPYQVGDTVIFTNTNNDTIRSVVLSNTPIFDAGHVRDPNPDCNVYYTTHYEGYYLKFSNLDIKHRNAPTTNPYYWAPRIEIYWSGAYFQFTAADIGSTKSTTAAAYYDSLLVNNVTYYAVSEFSGETKNDRIFITPKEGIIKLYNSNYNLVWTLIK